jgi:hypothetical protein
VIQHPCEQLAAVLDLIALPGASTLHGETIKGAYLAGKLSQQFYPVVHSVASELAALLGTSNNRKSCPRQKDAVKQLKFINS